MNSVPTSDCSDLSDDDDLRANGPPRNLDGKAHSVWGNRRRSELYCAPSHAGIDRVSAPDMTSCHEGLASVFMIRPDR